MISDWICATSIDVTHRIEIARLKGVIPPTDRRRRTLFQLLVARASVGFPEKGTSLLGHGEADAGSKLVLNRAPYTRKKKGDRGVKG